MAAEVLLRALRNPDRGRRNLAALEAALGAERLQELAPALGRALARSPDCDMALNNFERVASACAVRGLTLSPPPQPSPAEGGGGRKGLAGRELETLLQLLGTSQFFADLLAAQPELLDSLRPRRAAGPVRLAEELQAESDAADTDAGLLRAFRHFRRRHLLRIGAGDVLRDRPLEEVTRDLARVADAAIEVALRVALRHAAGRFGEPRTAAGRPARCAVLAFGKLGGEELNYSSDLDLMFVYDEEGATIGKGIDLGEFYARVVGEVVRLLSAHTADGQAYRVDLRLRPEGSRGPLARSLAGTLAYYDALGRTWERQALIKLRPVAGDVELGTEFLRAVEPFVYRKYLSFAEINEIKAMKRKIEQKARHAGIDDVEVKTGRGGIRDVEFAIQFLQLLNGGDLPEVRQRNTLLAMQALAGAGCLTDQEYQILAHSYRFLRKTEHRLQLLFDLQTHRLPDHPDELRRLALRMGYGDISSTRKVFPPPPSAGEGTRRGDGARRR